MDRIIAEIGKKKEQIETLGKVLAILEKSKYSSL